MLKTVGLLFFLVSSVVVSGVYAKTPDGRDACIGHDCARCHTLSTKDAGELLRPLGVTIQSIKPAPVLGMFEVLAYRGDQQGVIYVDFAKKHIMQGVVVRVEGMEAITAHTKEPPQLEQVSALDLKKVPLQHSVVMGSPNAAKKLIVFTDPDCPYCRTLHIELLKLEKIAPDIAIHIMLYPLPMHPQAYDKARMLVASKDKQLLNRAFEGKEIPQPKNDEGKAAIDAILGFAQKHGLTGTPTLVLPDGKLVMGAHDAESLKKLVAGH